jgi:choline dehydrogenase
MDHMTEADYVIVGAGSAGCVVAARLSEDPGIRVVLLEAGPPPRSPWIRIPSGVAKLIFPSPYNWGYFSEPVPGLNGRRVYAPRGRTLGGSSAINGMAFVRGQHDDYEIWRQLGNVGWAWDDVLPHFRRMETRVGGDPALRGTTGALHVTDPIVQHPTSRAFVEAVVATGVPPTRDYNGATQEGASLLQQTIRDGRRHSTADAFLAPARNRGNLQVITGAHVERVIIRDGVATGVAYRIDGQARQVTAKREVILSAGSLNTPKTLMLSGIGPGDVLTSFGLDVLHDSPGVGRNLQDHMWINYRASATAKASVNGEFRGWRRFMHGFHYLVARKGMLTMTGTQATAFVSVMPGASRPDVQFLFRPYSWGLNAQGQIEVTKEPTVSASISPMQPESRGHVTLTSPEIEAPPAIHPNYLSTSRDAATAVEAVKVLRSFFRQEPLASLAIEELLPGPQCTSDEQILDFVRNTGESMHHWAGTCRMGSDPTAVVDSRLRVHGVGRLRVVDASIMPQITSGNINAPTIMIGEKGAAMIREDR